ncbi:MAG: GGDEF domain-containing protein [Treponema sp.]|jgi:diguanylate cyclase (GGDEF)-like protein|nr:GGDEF domain-containing protein [Treponema sp.]
MTDNVRDIQLLEKQIYDLKELFEISKSLNSTLDFSILIESLLLICMAQLKVLKVCLFVRKHLDSEEFSLHRNYTGFELDHSLPYVIPEDHALMRYFGRNYDCHTLDEIHAGNVSLEGLDPIINLNPSLLVPLKAKGRINGLIMLGDRIGEDAFDSYDREYIRNVATLASIAINNASLFEMATTDMMTKLKMKHHLFSILNEWLAIERPNESFSMLLFDIDHFKKVNDTYGHSCGDMALKFIAQILMDNIRSSDIAARYGGEEFIILIAHPGKALAMKVAERIRSTIAESEIAYKGHIIRLTISCGVVCYDRNLDGTAEAMIDRADKALYRSKQDGRNRITFSPL